MLYASVNFLPNSSDAKRIRLWSLKKSAIPADYIGHPVLRCSVEFCNVLDIPKDVCAASVPSEAKTMGLSGLDGSVKQNTSARPSEASLKCDGRVPVIRL